MPHAALLRTVRFRATHHYGFRDRTEEDNARDFGELVHAHPHDYAVEVTVRGRLDPETGFVTDLGRLDEILSEEVVSPLEGTLLNESVPPFRGGRMQPSCEALAWWIGGRILPRLDSELVLERVRVREDESLAGEARWAP